MDECIQKLQSKDTKERMAGVEKLQTVLEHSRKGLSAMEASNLVDATLGLLKDNNFKVCQGALQALACAAALGGEHLRAHFNAFLPAVIERLGDGKQPVRDAARRLLLALMEISSPSTVVERYGNCAWTHKNWRVREEFARTATSAINLFNDLSFQRIVLPQILGLLEDSNSSVREACMMSLEEMYRQGGMHFKEELQKHSLRPSQLKEISARFEKIIPKVRTYENATSTDTKHNTTGVSRRNSPKSKSSLELSSTAEMDASEKPMEPLRVSSERELAKEIEKLATMLTPEQDWSVRISAMQRVEALVAGGAAEYSCFPSLLKQLVGPLCLQLSDRRSSIVKQACHLLNLLSKDLLSEFEPIAEATIPVLFKLVVITVLVIAESADNCIKTMLRNCRVSRVLPRIVDCAKNDRSAILRARCCEYALLVLEQWADSPEIQRSVDFYEDLIKSCVGDAMSEVRSTARSCYRLFAKTWPDRGRRVFTAFDPVIQKLLNEEEGNYAKRYTSPVRERVHHVRNSAPVTASTVLQSANETQMERNLSSSATSTSFSSQRRPADIPFVDRNLENMFQASQQQVSAIEIMLKGMGVPDKSVVSTTSRLIGKDPAGGSYRKIHAPLIAGRVNVDPPSARDAPHPASAPATNHVNIPNHTNISIIRPPANMRNAHFEASTPSISESGRSAHIAKRVPMTAERSSQTLSVAEVDTKGPKRVLRTDSENIPGFQRPLMRVSVSGKSSVSSRCSSMEEPQSSSHNTETYSCLDGLMSLNDALTEGLSVNADWSARVSAFTYLRKLLQQGPRGMHDINQNFEKIMKLFYEHLDDPHHKVTHAALSTLAELVPPCRKQFESYLERILPRVFSRLIDAKEVIRQLGTSALEIIGNIYSIDSLLPALLRSLDEQRSPKAKMAVIEFAIAAFAKLALNGEAAGGSGLLKLWLAKLAPLANDKNPKLKETAVTGIISVYSHFDATTVLNFILGLSIEEQSILRRALKQYTPRIEVDLMTCLQNRNQSQRGKNLTKSEETSQGQGQNQNQSQSPQNTGEGGKRKNVEIANTSENQVGATTVGNVGGVWDTVGNVWDTAGIHGNVREFETSPERCVQSTDARSIPLGIGYVEPYVNVDTRTGSSSEAYKSQGGYEYLYEEKAMHRKLHKGMDSGSGRLLHKFLSWSEVPEHDKREALQEFPQLLRANDSTLLSQYPNQILAVILEAFDDPDPILRENAVTTIPEIVSTQRGVIDDTLDVVLEKLIHASRDQSVKVSTMADRCLSAVLSQCDPRRCLAVVIPLLVSDDDKTLVTCISCLTKLVTRLPQEELMAQLPSFLPPLFDAFGNKNADVRKTVVFCLVDIYIVLGKAFVPYLGSLSSTQLRLVTIYANRITQARTGSTLDTQ